MGSNLIQNKTRLEFIKRINRYKTKSYKKIISDLYHHKVPFQYPKSVLSNRMCLDKRMKDAGGFCRVYRKWTNQLVAWIRGKKVLEVMSGNGMLSYALKQGGVNIRSTDNMMWRKFIHANKWPVEIEQIDAVHAVDKYGKDIDYILMAWPIYNEPLAYRVTRKMYETNPNCLCIYIGEWHDGCTADNDFFDNVEIMQDGWFNNIAKLYRNFDGLHDSLYLLRYKANRLLRVI